MILTAFNQINFFLRMHKKHNKRQSTFYSFICHIVQTFYHLTIVNGHKFYLKNAAATTFDAFLSVYSFYISIFIHQKKFFFPTKLLY